MALAALAGLNELDQTWATLLQHRFGGSGALAGHPVGNLILTGLLEGGTDPVEALATVARLIGAVGRVLPMSPIPLDLVADVDRLDPEEPELTRLIRGQSSIAATLGRVQGVRLLPAGAPACAAAVDAVREADAVVLGPGSWFSSVIPHLLLRELGQAIVSTPAAVVVTLNLVPQVGETEHLAAHELIEVLFSHAPGLRIDAIVADETSVSDLAPLRRLASRISARLVMSALTGDGSRERHDPLRLSRALEAAFGWGGVRPR